MSNKICTLWWVYGGFSARLDILLLDFHMHGDPPPTYGCPESKRHTERYQLQKLYQFLTGLDESYENAKNQVLMTRPLPNINQANAMIINVESQRMHGKGASSLTDNNEAASMMSNKPYNSNYNEGYNNNGGFNTNNYNHY
ncbi:uncharacterized protein [Nicotiana tomentosiformis]|uniref:uncharacterized protein n=1 Tax=Nicotiana tomentosiformis TaxID=4098 RepID=UPI00388CAB39